MTAQGDAQFSFLQELKRRKVYHTAVSYGAVVFAVWQVADIAVPALGLPPSFMRFVVIVALLGFPLALVLSWLFEVLPQSAAEGALPSRRRWGRATLLACVVALLLGTVGWSVASQEAMALTGGEWVLLTDLRGQVEDSAFAGAMDEALRLALTQSSVVNVFPPARVREGLVRMRRPVDTYLDEATAVELAMREGVPVVLVPSLRRVGEQLTFSCRIVDPRSGETVRSRSTRASGENEALAALDELARELRQDLGESLGSLVRNRLQLHRATTASLEALKAWTEGNRLYDSVRQEEAGVLYRRAVALDSTFALAQADLGQWYYWNQNDPLAGNAAFDAALRHTHGLPERERLAVVGKAAEWRGNREGAIAAYRAITEIVPDDPNAWGNLAYQYLRLDRRREAIEAYGKVLELDSLDANAWINLATAHIGKDTYADAVPLYERALQIQPNYRTTPGVNEEYGQTLIALGRYEDATTLFSALLEGSASDRARGLRSLAMLDMLQGRYGSAVDRLRRSVVLHEAEGNTVSELRDRAYLASALLRQGRRSEAAAEARAAGALALGNYVATYWAAISGVASARAGEPGLAGALLDTARVRSNGGLDDRAFVRYLDGVIALSAGDAGRAAQSLQDAMTLAPALAQSWAAAAEAQRRLGNLDEAARLWAELEDRGVGEAAKEAQEGWVLAHYELGKVQEELGRPQGAMASYRAFLSLWGEGDPDLVEIADARQRLAELQEPGSL